MPDTFADEPKIYQDAQGRWTSPEKATSPTDRKAIRDKRLAERAAKRKQLDAEETSDAAEAEIDSLEATYGPVGTDGRPKGLPDNATPDDEIAAAEELLANAKAKKKRLDAGTKIGDEVAKLADEFGDGNGPDAVAEFAAKSIADAMDGVKSGDSKSAMEGLESAFMALNFAVNARSDMAKKLDADGDEAGANTHLDARDGYAKALGAVNRLFQELGGRKLRPPRKVAEKNAAKEAEKTAGKKAGKKGRRAEDGSSVSYQDTGVAMTITDELSSDDPFEGIFDDFDDEDAKLVKDAQAKAGFTAEFAAELIMCQAKGCELAATKQILVAAGEFFSCDEHVSWFVMPGDKTATITELDQAPPVIDAPGGEETEPVLLVIATEDGEEFADGDPVLAAATIIQGPTTFGTSGNPMYVTVTSTGQFHAGHPNQSIHGSKAKAGRRTTAAGNGTGKDAGSDGRTSDGFAFDDPVPLTAPWEGILVVEGVETGDRRLIREGALTWRDLPLPLMVMFRNPDGGEGHAAAELAGRIDEIWRDEENPAIIRGRGVLDLGGTVGQEAHRLMDGGFLRGNSVDIDMVEAQSEAMTPEDLLAGGGRTVITSGRLMGSSLLPFPAFQEATLTLIPELDEALVATGALRASVYTPMVEALVAAGGRIPVNPPVSSFTKPVLTEKTPVRVAADGFTIYGHVACWDTPHIGFDGRLVYPPRGDGLYRYAQNKQTLTAEGTLVATCPVFIDTVHPDLKRKASDAQAHYADTGCAVADVHVWDDEFGVVIAGTLRPGVTDEQLRVLRGSDISPDWRPHFGGLQMVALLGCNTSGFVTPALERELALVASGARVRPGTSAVLFDAAGAPMAMVGVGLLRHGFTAATPHTARIAQLEAKVAELESFMLNERAHRALAALGATVPFG